MTADNSSPAPAGKTKVEKAHSYLSVVSTSIGIIGAIGTLAVWVGTTFFLGDVQIRPDKPVDTICIKVIDRKGQSAIYYGKDVQLLPGKYHLEITVPERTPATHADADVKLWHITTIPFTVPETISHTGQNPGDQQAGQGALGQQSGQTGADQQPSDNADDQGGGRKHWWQFWKKRQ